MSTNETKMGALATKGGQIATNSGGKNKIQSRRTRKVLEEECMAQTDKGTKIAKTDEQDSEPIDFGH